MQSAVVIFHAFPSLDPSFPSRDHTCYYYITLSLFSHLQITAIKPSSHFKKQNRADFLYLKNMFSPHLTKCHNIFQKLLTKHPYSPDSRQKRKLSCTFSNCCVLSFNNQIPAMTVFLRFFIVCYESFCFPLCFYAFFFTRFLQLVFLQPFACMSCNLADTSVFYRGGESHTCYQPEECICSAALYKHFIFFPRLFPVLFNLQPEL